MEAEMEHVCSSSASPWQPPSGNLSLQHYPTPINCIWATYGLDIINGGMTGFGKTDVGNADHRMLWLDIAETSLFGFQPSPPSKQPHNSILLHNPAVVRRYNNYVILERKRHRIPEKTLALEQRAQPQCFNEDDTLEYEQLLVLSWQFLTGQVPYSNLIGRELKELHLWDMVISRRQGKQTNTRAIRQLMVQTGITNAL